MKIKSIEIQGVGGIKNLKVDFDETMNFICGPNGIGKTTLIECVAHSFTSSSTNILKKNVSTNNNYYKVDIIVDGQVLSTNINISEFDPVKSSFINGLSNYSSKLMSLKVTRSFNYQNLDSLGKDTNKNNSTLYRECISGLNIKEIKNWFVNRHMYLPHEGSLKTEQINNFETAKESISLLSEGYSFSRVEGTSFDIMINTPTGEIYYEYLSSGFKSCLSIIFGIIKEIEFRFKEPCINANDFDGIILIDELELHLHPEWQTKIAETLIKVFPKAQFITTTHSPHILQNAKPNQIIALCSEGDQITRKNLSESKYGYQGWSIEEILVDVMGMSDTRTDIYNDLMESFSSAIDKEDYQKSLEIYEKLDVLLHPNNHLRKLLKFQLAAIRG
ncbi:AAA family ATPase [Francisella philomiragia]|uniref:AAA family ATPase n=1 Tax=Francisella philomiragia TaxID=28110 RepID=UPI001904F8B9|nr:AAA family ATPase [Francisella philomiragia]MBK2105474.1 AAA family ATPase [Francisella philomiragia]